MSPEQLYLRYDPTDPVASARYASYAFLKRHPTESFKSNYLKFRSGSLNADDFAVQIITDPGFDDFLGQFVKYWLENRTILDETRFDILDLNLPYALETQHYLKHMMVHNRPVVELVDSDYRTLSAPMASFYGINAEGLDRYEPRLVQTREAGGIIHQANFFVARSDGVDPRPFSRAAWIVENAFGKRLSEPPANINAEQFVASAKTMTFEERVKVHSRNNACASCHRKIDPVAFALSDYDTIGRMIGKPNAQAKRELNLRLSRSGQTMARSLTRNLIAFVVGRDTNLYDLKMIEHILEKTEGTEYCVQDILAEILRIYFRD